MLLKILLKILLADKNIRVPTDIGLTKHAITKSYWILRIEISLYGLLDGQLIISGALDIETNDVLFNLLTNKVCLLRSARNGYNLQYDF